MADALTRSIIKSLRESQWQQYEELVGSIRNQAETQALWVVLGGAHGRDIDLLAQLLAWPTDRLGAAVNRLLPAVGQIPELNAPDTLRLLQFAERLQPSYWYSVSEQLRPHIAAFPQLGRQVGEQLRTTELPGYGALRVWAGAFSTEAPETAANFALSLATGDPGDSPPLAALIQFLPMHNSAVHALLVPKEANLAKLLWNATPTLGSTAWTSLTNLADLSPSAMDILEQSIERGEIEATLAVANWMHQVSTPRVGASGLPLDNLVRKLLHAALTHEQTRAQVDNGVAQLLYRPALRQYVLPCVTELGNSDANAVEIFPSIFVGVCDAPNDFHQILTVWLLSPDVTFSAVASLISLCSREQALVGLDVATFNLTMPERQLVAARRLLALTHHGQVLCSFIAVLAETPALQPAGFDIAVQMLNEAFDEYPGATVEFLEKRTRPASRKEPFAHAYRSVYANALRWRRVLARLPPLNELCPTDTQLLALRSMKQRMNRDIMRGVAEQSIFASLVTSAHVAQGRRFASHNNFGAPLMAEMTESSHSIELPSSELADPVGGMLRRATTLRGAR
ncbi:hypothetical protein T3A99_12405 [Pseudomonas sp. N-137]|uniref:hypothetical protein n=1 Tax=Pseudomonas sp. N-137 TaxID=3108452 RepID=UPI002ADEC3B0|nr:hypothetical protein [Pseudomonas sp. N-137]MEA1029369.1 hypothetical protein [Pseudomonas sp. N-137]